jgi:uroporphyrinogen decarboxylase
MNKPVLDVLAGRICNPPPVWIMRQAGRYLPEYRRAREQAGDFAAILFSDILLVPFALGQAVSFIEGEGPRLAPIADRKALRSLKSEPDQNIFQPVYETVGRVRQQLDDNATLLGFCGAPWTVATYMVGGGGSMDQAPARLFAYRDPEMFAALIDLLVEASASHLIRQLRAGADAVQIFDSWAGILPPTEFYRWCIEPTRRLVANVRQSVPDARIIGFPRGAGVSLFDYVENMPVDAVGLDWTMDMHVVREKVRPGLPLQGKLDPIVLLAGGAALDRAVDENLADFAGRPFIFNLGHGILPQTPVAHVEQMLARIRAS